MKSEVVGWVFEDPEHSGILVREANGQVRTQKANPGSANGELTIQTGAFRRGKRLIDAVTAEALGYEMQRMSTAYALD